MPFKSQVLMLHRLFFLETYYAFQKSSFYVTFVYSSLKHTIPSKIGFFDNTGANILRMRVNLLLIM